jgi:Spy/CpxP family protein refolding chaperone
VSISLTFTSSSFAGSDHHPRKNEFRQILKQLDLSQTQVQDVRQLMKQGHEDKSVYRLDMRGISSQLKTLIQNTAWDQQAIETVLLQRMDLIAQIGWQKATKKNQVWQLLTSQQQSELVLLVGNRDKKIGKNGRSFKVLETLDLSDEQAAEIDLIKAEFKALTSDSKANLKEFRQAQHTLRRADRLEQGDWQALEAKYQDDKLAMAIAKTQVRHNIWNVLNTEQQTQLQDRKQGRQQNRQRRSEERI